MSKRWSRQQDFPGSASGQVGVKARRARRLALAVTAILPLVGLAAPAAHADVNLRFPGESPGIPAYARFSQDPIHTDAWVAVPFYRLPSCVPSDFNLLSIFDVPRAFGCPMTIEGHEVWKLGPGQEPAPKVAITRAQDVPIWFASWSELQGAMSDGVVTVGELSALDSLVLGTADRYHEVLRPPGMIVVNAQGTLLDGRSFRVHACLCNEGPPIVRITVK